jgi:hypothetical protein
MQQHCPRGGVPAESGRRICKQQTAVYKEAKGVLMSRDGKKQDNSFGQQREEWRRAYAAALSLRERFPRVEQLVLDMSFTDPKAIGTYSPQMRSYSAPAKAFFAFACPRTLCVHGGFDLDPLIVTLLGSHRTSASGVLKCQGWVHPQHTESARCLLQMHYDLRAVYEIPKATGAGGRARV